MDEVPSEFKLSTEVEIGFNAEDILRNLTPLQVVQLVKELEHGSRDWEVTVLLARHFNTLQIEAIKEHPELLEASDEELEHELIQQAALDAMEVPEDSAPSLESQIEEAEAASETAG